MKIKIQMRTKMNSNLEYRTYSCEIRIPNKDSRKIAGLAIPVESRSQLLGGAFYETISRNAVNEQLILTNDVRLLVDHEPMRGSLGRSKYGEGTLRLSIDERGLNYEINLPDTPFGNETLDAVRRGDIDAVSFGFYAGEDEWSGNADGTYERRINDIEKLIEISLLDVAPAYTATDVTMRSLDEYKRSLEEKKEEEEDDDNDNNPDSSNDDTVDDKKDEPVDDKDEEEKQCDDDQEKINERLQSLKLEFEELAKI